jgi:predicted amidophosphoribosyltransferase
MRCGGCGAELHLGPDRCPLCGAEASFTGASKREQVTVEDYQLRIRELRKQLKRLRDDGAEAV